MHEREPSFFIEGIPIYGKLILAPMDGISDLPYRSLCRQFGSAMSYSSFVGAIEILQGKERAWKELQFLPEERPVALQIFDSSVERLTEAAKEISILQPDIIDINMGCSVRRVSGRGAGAGLLRDTNQIAELISTLSSDLDFPISAKIRLGWDKNSLNYLEVARKIEDSGGSLIAVHARTREQAYTGSADWDAIAEIKNAVNIPVVGNGDVENIADIDRLMDHTGCDAVMIGRAAMGNPWIFQRRDRVDVPVDEIAEVISKHLGRMIDFYGLENGLIRFRKHLVRYLRPANLGDTIRRSLLTCTELAPFMELMSEVGLPITGIEMSTSQSVI